MVLPGSGLAESPEISSIPAVSPALRQKPSFVPDGETLPSRALRVFLSSDSLPKEAQWFRSVDRVPVLVEGFAREELPDRLERTKFQYLAENQIEGLAQAASQNSQRPFYYLSLAPGKPTREGWPTLVIRRCGVKLGVPAKCLAEDWFAGVPINGGLCAMGYAPHASVQAQPLTLRDFVSKAWQEYLPWEKMSESERWMYRRHTLYVVAEDLAPEDLPTEMGHLKFAYVSEDESERLDGEKAAKGIGLFSLRLRPGEKTKEGWRTILFKWGGTDISFAEVAIDGEYRVVCFDRSVVCVGPWRPKAERAVLDIPSVEIKLAAPKPIPPEEF